MPPAPCSGSGSTAIARCTPGSATRPTPSGFQQILRNALLGGEPKSARGRAAAAGSAARATAERRARDAARGVIGDTEAIRLAVSPATAPAAEDVLSGFGASYSVQRSPGRAAYVIANPEGLTAEEHPFARLLPAALEDAGVATIALRMP